MKLVEYPRGTILEIWHGPFLNEVVTVGHPEYDADGIYITNQDGSVTGVNSKQQEIDQANAKLKVRG